MKTKKPFLPKLPKEHILELSNDIAEGIKSGSITEIRCVAFYHMMEHDIANQKLCSLLGTLALIEACENMAKSSKEELHAKLKEMANETQT